MKLSIQKFILPSVPFAMLLIVACVVLWGVNFSTHQYFKQLPSPPTAFGEIENMLSWSKRTLEILGLVLILFNTFLLSQLNIKYSIIRTRTLLHTFLYLMSLSVWSAFDITITDHLACTFLLFSLLIFMGMYRDKQAVRKAFTSSFFLGISSFFAPPLIYTLPALWIGMILFQSISLRTFLASLLGILNPWIFYFWIEWEFQPNYVWLSDLMKALTPTIPLFNLENFKIAFLIANVLILFVSLGYFFTILRQDSIQTRQRLKIFVWIFFISLLATLFYSSALSAFLTVIAVAFSILVAHPLTLQKSMVHSILFIMLCVINISFVLINLFYYST